MTVINNNGGLAQGIPDIEGVYGDRPGKPQELYEFGPVNFARLAREMGCNGVRVEDPDHVSGALQDALAADAPTVVEVMTGIQYHSQKPWAPSN